MPNYSMDNGSDKDKVPDLLKGFGSAVGEFSQGEFRTRYAVPVGRSPIDKSNYRAQGLGGGYCAGVCLDWIRRVLLSRPERDERYLTYQYANLKSGRRTFDSKDTKRSTEASAARSRQNVQVQADAYALSNSLNWYKESETVSHLDPTEFKKETARMDVFFDKSRKEAGREASSKHFSQLELVESKMSTYASASQWMNELFGSLIAGGCVSYLGFNSGTTGHAVAVWQRKHSPDDQGSFYLFDPNFGVYSYSKAGLRNAIKVLFGTEAGHTPYYSMCSSATAQRLKVMIFGPPRHVTAMAESEVDVEVEHETITLPPPQPTHPQPELPHTSSSASPVRAPTTLTSEPVVHEPMILPTTPRPTASSGATPYGASTIPFSLPRPGNNTAPTRGASQSATGKLSAELDRQLKDAAKVKAKSGGKAASTWRGFEYSDWTTMDATLVSKLRATKVVDWNQLAVKEGLKGNDIERGLLATVIERLKQSDL